MSQGRIAWLAGLTIVYFAAGKLGLSLAFTHASASAVWPPAGVALAALLIVGRHLWPGVLLGAFLVNVTTTGDVLSSAGIAVGNMLEAVLGAWLVHRVAGGPAALRRAEGVFRFAGLAVPLPAAVAATIGIASLAAAGLAEPAALPSIWITWWLGDTSGAIIVAPLIILWAWRPRLHWTRGKAPEAALLAVAMLLTALVLFRGLIPPIAQGYPLAFLALPTLLWAAFRFGERETVTVSALFSASAVWGTLDGYGPFASLPPEQSLVVVQAFIGVVTVAMLAAAAEVGSRADADAALVRLNIELEARVASRTELLERTQARLNEAQQVAHIGSWDWDIARDSLWWSAELYRIYGVDPEHFELTYQRFLSLVHPDDRERLESTVATALKTGEPFSVEHRIVRPDGAVRLTYGRGHLVADVAGRPLRMLGIGQDITERHLAEQERTQLAREQAARREAEEANDAKDQFLALLSHELRTPVNAVMGWAQLLAQGKLEAAVRDKAIAAIYRNARIQAGLVADLLDASRIRAGTLRLALETLDLAAVVTDAVESIRPMAISKEIRVVTDVAPVQMVGDAERLGQVIRNLVLNSVKFASSGGQVSLTSRTADERVRITVEDDGPGISADFLPHLFEQFRQADPSMTREHQGLGLGLAIVRQIVTLHGGTVEAANRPNGAGAIFTVDLPIGLAGDPRVCFGWDCRADCTDS